jgi:hypothetical protein
LLLGSSDSRESLEDLPNYADLPNTVLMIYIVELGRLPNIVIHIYWIVVYNSCNKMNMKIRKSMHLFIVFATQC